MTAYLQLAKAIEEKGEPACAGADPESFFPEKGDSATLEVRMSRQICKTCEVRPECLIYALVAQEPYGIWGGLTTEERNALRRMRPTEREARLSQLLQNP
jgi:WhiB family redox-sensing transcriptional regulator